MSPFAVIIPMAPGYKDVERAADLLQSLAAHEPGPALALLIDDDPRQRALADVLNFPADYTPVILRHFRHSLPEPQPPSTNGPHCAGMLQAYQWIARNRPDVSFILRLDTDALVIAPFAAKIAAALGAAPDIAILGAYTHTPNGEERDVTHHAATIQRLHRPPLRWTAPRSIFDNLCARTGWGIAGRLSQHIEQARASGYRYGEHCMGGAMALSTELIRRMMQHGYLDDPALWLRVARTNEDAMIAIYARAVGMRLENCVRDGQVFGVRWRGLADTPARLLARGYSIIHSIKSDPHFTEEQIRSFYRAHRTARGRSLAPIRPEPERRNVASAP